MPWLHATFDCPLWSKGFFNLLVSRPSIRFFLNKTWGSKAIDEGLFEYDYLTTHQPGARHAPYYFVSGYLSWRHIPPRGLTFRYGGPWRARRLHRSRRERGRSKPN
jgi:hypothetical protein